MKTFDLRLEFKQLGSLLNAQVILEGSHQVGYWDYDSTKRLYYKDLSKYSIDDEKLLVSFAIEGKSGANGKLAIIVDKKQLDELVCDIPGGYNTCLIKKDISIPDKTSSTPVAAVASSN